MLDNLFKAIDKREQQIPIIEKLYKKYGLKIVCTCDCMPEQYEIFKDNVQVGYLRLRWGEFRIDYPDCGGDVLLECFPDGDGIFEDYERFNYLSKAMRCILSHLKQI